MNYTVEPIEDSERRKLSGFTKIFTAKVNGETLTDKRGYVRRFASSKAAALAGSRYVDEVLRPNHVSSAGIKS